jgi:hypothetical protein
MNPGRDRSPVGRPVFKTGRGCQAVPGRFDSCSLPPFPDPFRAPSIRYRPRIPLRSIRATTVPETRLLTRRGVDHHSGQSRVLAPTLQRRCRVGSSSSRGQRLYFWKTRQCLDMEPRTVFRRSLSPPPRRISFPLPLSRSPHLPSGLAPKGHPEHRSSPRRSRRTILADSAGIDRPLHEVRNRCRWLAPLSRRNTPAYRLRSNHGIFVWGDGDKDQVVGSRQ